MNKNKCKKVFLLIALMLISLYMTALSGCGFFEVDIPSSEGSIDENEDYIVVGFSQLGSESVWRSANTISVQNSLSKENGFLLEFNNARQKQENQFKAIRSFISQRVDYIVFSPVTEDGWETVLKEAKEAGVPVIIADRMISGNNDSLYEAWVGSNTREEGEKAGRWLEKDLQSKGKIYKDINIVVLQGTTGSSAQLGRTIGFDVIADQHKNWHILEQTSGDFTTAKGKEVMQSMLEKYDDINVVVCQNDDMAFGAIEALEEKGMTYGLDGDITLISFDGGVEALKLVEDGMINLDVECNPEQGDYIADIIMKLENGETVEKKTYVDERIITIENASEILQEKISKSEKK